MKNNILKIVSVLIMVIAVMVSFSLVSNGGFTYKGTYYGTIESLSKLAKNNNELFREIPASTVLGAWLDYGNLDPYDSNVVCMEHYNKNDSGKYGYVWRVIDINPDGVNTLRVNGESWNIKDTYTKRYLNAVAEAAAKSKAGGWKNWGLSDTKAAYVSLANSTTLADIFKLNGSYGEYDYVYNSNVQWYINEYWKNAEKPANATNTDVVALSVENGQTYSVSDGTIIGPFKYKSASGENITFNSIKVIGKDNNDNVIHENTIENPSASNLFTDSLGTTPIANGSIKSEQEFYIKTSSEINNAAKVKVEVNVNGVGYYQTRILIYRHDAQQTFSSYSVGNGQTTKSGQSLEYEFDNNRGNIEIHKSGIYTGIPVNKIEGIGFRAYYVENNKNIYLIIDKENVIGTTENVDEATIIHTDSNGDAYIRKVDSRYTYYLEESSNNTDYSINILKATQQKDGEQGKKDVPIVAKGKIGPIDVDRQQQSSQTTVEIEDARKTGKLKIIKQDYDKNNIKISGVKFKVQNKETKQWIKANGKDGVYNLKTYDSDYSKNKEYYKDNYTSDINQATEFETNKDGQIVINGVDVGEYILKEVNIFNDNGKINYGYTEVDKPSNIDKNYVFWSPDNGKTKYELAKKDIKLKVEDSDKTAESTIIVYNKKKYLKIRGYVWEEVAGGKSTSYDLYGTDIYVQGDKLVEGINVRLKDNDGNIISTSKTDKDGAYEFLEVSREAVEKGQYYVEFEYDGVTYTSVVPLVGNDNTINSKAGEIVDQRKKLNAAFAEITNKDDINDRSHGYSRDSKGNVTGTLTYKNNTENWYSTFEGTTYNNETYENVNLTANTNVAGYSLEKEFKEGRYIVDDSGAFVLKDINLGMRRREMPQISVSNDIANVQVDINGYSHRYDYSQRNSYVEDKSAFNVGVKFGKEYVSGYTRAIYPSDVQYSSTDASDSNKLKVYVTYVTTIRNLSNELTVTANELVNYYDKQYTIKNSWIDDNTDNIITWSKTSKYGQKYDDGKFEAAYSTGLAGTKINAGSNMKVYITFQVSDDAVLGLLNNKATLDNTMEIFSYSTYYGKDAEGCKVGDIYAGIDKASAPGNAKMELDGENRLIKTTYEADTDSAPSLLLEAWGVRIIEGNAFEDETPGEIQSGDERKGDGIYTANKENLVSGVKVQLLTSEGTIATIYPDAADANGNPVANTIGQRAEMTTGSDGHYIFKGIEPGIYYIRYTYENGVTKVVDMNGKEVKDISVQNYKSTIIPSEAKSLRDAFADNDAHLTWYKDNSIRYSDALDNYEQRNAIDEELKHLDGKTKTEKNSLFADSPKFDLNIEYESIYTASKGDRYEYKVSDIDFGIVERPRQQADLDKIVSNIKVTLPNGQVLVDGDPSGKLDYVTVTGDAIYITIDNELIYGSHIEIKYDLKLTNSSEVDYISKNYYYYGVKEGEPVKFTRATLIDYVDKDLILKAGQNGNWTVLGTAEDFAKQGLNWDLSREQEEALLKKFSTIVKAEPVSEKDPIAPGETVSSQIIVEKLLSTNDQELSYDNNGEVVTIGKTGGSIMTTKLGNYAGVFAENQEELYQLEPDEANSKSINIIPPTGSTDNTVMYSVIAAASLAVLGAGTYGVRKFLKK